MYKKKLNDDDVFSYIKLGSNIAKIFFVIASENNEYDEQYCELVDDCNKRFKYLEIDYSIEKREFIDVANVIGREVISKQFKEPFWNEKYILFEIGYHLMILGLVELDNGKDKINDLYKMFKEFLTDLKIPTYDLLKNLFDNKIDMDQRVTTFSYKICRFLGGREIDKDDSDTGKSSLVTFERNIINGNYNIIGNNSNLSVTEVNDLFLI